MVLHPTSPPSSSPSAVSEIETRRRGPPAVGNGGGGQSKHTILALGRFSCGGPTGGGSQAEEEEEEGEIRVGESTTLPLSLLLLPSRPKGKGIKIRNFKISCNIVF